MLPAMVGSTPFCDHQCGYWRGALYICCSDCFVMRISPSDNKYRVNRMPTEDPGDGQFYLGKSNKEIYCALLPSLLRPQLQVWFLNERCGQTEWVLKHDIDISHILPNLNYDEQQRDGPWTLQNYNYRPFYDDDYYGEPESMMEEKFEKFEWDSDNDNVLEPGSRRKDCYIYFLRFHPYKDIVFLGDEFDGVLAYNWSSSKLQDLGKVFTEFYIHLTTYMNYDKLVRSSFPYTPCWLGELPEKLNL